MPSKAETTIRSRIWKPLALLALAAAACAGLAGCGGGRSGGAEQVMIVPSPEGRPDLVVESASVSDAGAVITLSARVLNAGGATASAATLRFYRSDDETIETSDTQVGADAVGELAASGSADASVELSASQAPGLYYYGACVDAAEGESETANNCSMAVQVTVPGSRPDLVVESLSVSDANPIARADITLSARVRNDGDGRAAAVRLRFYRSLDETIETSDEEVGADEVGELAPSESRVASVEPAAPSTPGTYHYGACVDAVEGESDAANNCSAAVRVTAPALQFPASGPQVLLPGPRATPSPDLVLESPSVSDVNPLPDVYFVLSLNMRNAGDSKGVAVVAWVRVYRSDDATITRSDTQVNGLVPAWVPEPSKSIPFSVRLTSPSTAGTYYYGACVDAVPGESETANNCSTAVRVTVLEVPPPDLVLGSPRVSPASPVAGTNFRITVPVRNAGGRRAESSTMLIYRSEDETITRSDTPVGSHYLFPVGPFGRRSVKTSQRAPWTPGTYYYGTCVDAVPGESDAANNCSPSVEITVREAPPPDLVLGSPRVFPASPAAGGVFSLLVNVRNAGGRNVERTTLRYYRSDDATITPSDTQFGTLPRTKLLAGEGYDVAYGPLDTPDPGAYYYGVCVDTVAEESDTTNNCSAAVTLQVTHNKPNLQFHSWNMSRDSDGNPLQMDATLRNVGGPSAATTLRFYRSSDDVITPSDTQIDSVSVPALVKTEPRKFPRFRSGVVRVPAPPAPGAYYYGACVDEVPDESDTTDNCRLIDD